MVYVYDIELYRNFFSVIFKDVNSKELKEFVIFEDRNDIDSLYTFINDKTKWMVGYNSKRYDNQILNYIFKYYQNLSDLDSNATCDLLKNLSDDIILRDASDHIYRLPFQGIDLMSVGNIELKPLKLVAVNLKWPKIQDLPIEPDAIIKASEVDLMLKYNLNDVEITERLYEELRGSLKLRWNFGKKFNLNILNETDSGISNRLLEKIFSKALNLTPKELKTLGTDRTRVNYSDVILDVIKFQTPKFQNFLSRLKKGHLIVGDKSSKFKERIIYNGCAYVLGIGGIHSEDKPRLLEETPEYKIIDADVESYYPSSIINNNIFPEHLGNVFIKEYTDLKVERFRYKRSVDIESSDALKRALNSVFGKSMSMTHWVRDYNMALKITINCQLYLLMLIEALEEKGFDVLSANTDGIVTIVPRVREEEYKHICEDWEKLTKFDLEYTEYAKYIQRDVNNYISIKTDGKIKAKGTFTVKTPLEKGFNSPVVAKALYDYYVNGISMEHTIKNHKDIYDFCIARKSDKKFINEFHYLKDGRDHAIDVMQRTNRYFVSNKGGKLYKHDKAINKLSDVCVGHNLTIFNDYYESEDYDIDYSYYISRARKIKELIENPQLTLF